VVLIGGGTTKIGDPSGKDTVRQMLTPETIGKNVKGICSVGIVVCYDHKPLTDAIDT
jgi:tyrosyl-tRNA synthetase